MQSGTSARLSSSTERSSRPHWWELPNPLWLHCALAALYVMFSVAPVGASMKRDGVSAIETPPWYLAMAA